MVLPHGIQIQILEDKRHEDMCIFCGGEWMNLGINSDDIFGSKMPVIVILFFI